MGNIIQSFVMCCRLNTSSPFAKIIAGLYILLATFLIGFFVVKLALRVHWLNISGPESLALLSRVEPPDTHGPKANTDGPVAIEYIQSEPAPGDYQLVFKVTNFGSHTVSFSDDRRTCGLYRGTWHGLYISGAVPCSFEIDKLEPFQSTTLRASSYSDYAYYGLSVRYFVESEERERDVDLFITEPHESKP
jgi:hypothetical protein